MNDGGPAFPFHIKAVEGWSSAVDYPGMSLRDYFAAAALQGLTSNTDSIKFLQATGYSIETGCALFAERSFQIADAMLAAREQEKP